MSARSYQRRIVAGDTGPVRLFVLYGQFVRHKGVTEIDKEIRFVVQFIVEGDTVEIFTGTVVQMRVCLYIEYKRRTWASLGLERILRAALDYSTTTSTDNTDGTRSRYPAQDRRL